MVLGQEGHAEDAALTLEGRPSVWATAWVSCSVSLRPCGEGGAAVGTAGRRSLPTASLSLWRPVLAGPGCGAGRRGEANSEGFK